MPKTGIESLALPFADARDLGQRAFGLLVGHAVPPSPLNYAVAFAYLGAFIPELQAALDRQLDSGPEIDPAVLRELFEAHIGTERGAALRGLGTDLHALLLGLIRHIADAGSAAQAFGGALEGCLQRIDQVADPEALRRVAEELALATRAAQQRNEVLEEQLQHSLAETEHLRDELEEHRRAALLDPLTGLANRRAMDAHLAAMLRDGTPLSLLVVDIDHFKGINDSYGHALGDAVLRTVADAIRKCVRGGDLTVRYGGEEFVVLLPDTPLEGAARVAETIRARVAGLRLVRRRDSLRLAPFTVSIGVAALRPGEDADSLLGRADAAMYRSKEQGRDRVSVDGPGEGDAASAAIGEAISDASSPST